MSALGQKRTFAVQQPMSALPPIATSIAYFADLHRPQTEPTHRSSSARSSASTVIATELRSMPPRSSLHRLRARPQSSRPFSFAGMRATSALAPLLVPSSKPWKHKPKSRGVINDGAQNTTLTFPTCIETAFSSPATQPFPASEIGRSRLDGTGTNANAGPRKPPSMGVSGK